MVTGVPMGPESGLSSEMTGGGSGTNACGDAPPNAYGHAPR
jgi:hypothetical protein